MSETTNKRKWNNHSNSYHTSNPEILYAIADQGILHFYLHGCNRDRNDPTKMIYHFDRVQEIKDIFDMYEASGAGAADDTTVENDTPVINEIPANNAAGVDYDDSFENIVYGDLD
jgi:cytosine/adenosine deaminase-related metal-dependent hydrolase